MSKLKFVTMPNGDLIKRKAISKVYQLNSSANGTLSYDLHVQLYPDGSLVPTMSYKFTTEELRKEALKSIKVQL